MPPLLWPETYNRAGEARLARIALSNVAPVLSGTSYFWLTRVAVISAKNHKRQSVTAKREQSQTPKVLTAILTLPNLA